MPTINKEACSFVVDQGDWMFVPSTRRAHEDAKWSRRADDGRDGKHKYGAISASIHMWLSNTNRAIELRQNGEIPQALKFEARAEQAAQTIEKWQSNQCGLNR